MYTPVLSQFYMAKVATGEWLTTTLVCTEGGGHTEAPEAGPASSLAAPPLDEAGVVQPQEHAEVVDIDELSESEGPLTPTTMSVSYGYAATPAVSLKWGSGVLHTAPVGVMDLDSQPATPMAVQEPAMAVSEDEEDELPLSLLAQRRALQHLIAERTVRVPTHRLRRKTPRAALTKYKLVYKQSLAPRRPTELQQQRRYRVMYYKRDNAIAIRQCQAPKCQVGSCPLPHGMPIGQGRWIAQKVRLHFLEPDETWEPYTSDLLQQLLLTAPDYNLL